jgi:hypothetical protein
MAAGQLPVAPHLGPEVDGAEVDQDPPRPRRAFQQRFARDPAAIPHHWMNAAVADSRGR